jgi:hypothetical protein
MYNAAFFAILVIALQFTNATERGLLYILRSAGIVLGTGTDLYQIVKLHFDNQKEKGLQNIYTTFFQR